MAALQWWPLRWPLWGSEQAHHQATSFPCPSSRLRILSPRLDQGASQHNLGCGDFQAFLYYPVDFPGYVGCLAIGVEGPLKSLGPHGGLKSPSFLQALEHWVGREPPISVAHWSRHLGPPRTERIRWCISLRNKLVPGDELSAVLGLRCCETPPHLKLGPCADSSCCFAQSYSLSTIKGSSAWRCRDRGLVLNFLDHRTCTAGAVSHNTRLPAPLRP